MCVCIRARTHTHDTTSHPYTVTVNALTSLMWLLLKGTAALPVAQGEAHYHRIAGHETAVADFPAGRVILTHLLYQVPLST